MTVEVTPTIQPQPQGVATPEMLKFMRAQALQQQAQQSQPYGPFYSPWQGAADASAKIMGGIQARRADQLERQQLENAARAGVASLPSGKDSFWQGAGSFADPTASPTSLSHAALHLSTLGETGQSGFNAKSLGNIAPDANNSKSYGPFGLNSWKGSAKEFADAYPELGLTTAPGSKEFDAQWKAAVANNPDALINAHMDWHSKKIVNGLSDELTKAGVDPRLANDAQVQLYMADRKLQMGDTGLR